MRIAIVNDSPTAMESLRQVVLGAGFLIAWLAGDGTEAVERCRVDRPDLILMDLLMPRMNGVDAIREIMEKSPCAILVVTGSVSGNVSLVFEAMGAGAIDAVATPAFDAPESKKLLLEKIATVSKVSGLSLQPAPPLLPVEPTGKARACVLIGSSAGGPPALMEVISALPENLPAAVVIVQHVDDRFAIELASWLNGAAALPVGMAEEGGEPMTGQVLISHGGVHLKFMEGQRFHYTDHPRLSYQPSVDVLFESALLHGPRNLMGVVLTGMGRDGAQGLLSLFRAGHLTVAQDEASSAIYGMPRVAREIGAAKEVLPLSTIARRIIDWSTSVV